MANTNNNDYINLADILAKAFEEALARHNATADDYKSASKQKEILREIMKEITGSSEIPSFVGKMINEAVKEFSRDFKKMFESISKQAERAHYNRESDFTKYFYNNRTKQAFDNSNKQKDRSTRGTGASNLRNQTDKLELLISIVKNVGSRISKVNRRLSSTSKELAKASNSLAISSAELDESTNWIVDASKVIKRSTAQLGVWQKHLAVNAVELEREASWSRAINKTVGKTQRSMKQSNNATLDRMTDPETDTKEKEEKKSFADYLIDKLEKSSLGKHIGNVASDLIRLGAYKWASENADKHPLLARGALIAGANSEVITNILGGLVGGLAFSGLRSAGRGIGKLAGKAGKGLVGGLGSYFKVGSGLDYEMFAKGGLIGKMGEGLSKVGKFGRGLGLVGSIAGIGGGAYNLATGKTMKDKIFGGAEMVGGITMAIAPFLGPAAPIVMALGGILSFLEPISKLMAKVWLWLNKDKVKEVAGNVAEKAKGAVETVTDFVTGNHFSTNRLFTGQELFSALGGKSAFEIASGKGKRANDMVKYQHDTLLNLVKNNKAYDKLSYYKNSKNGGLFKIEGMTHGVPYAPAGTQAYYQSLIDRTGRRMIVTGGLGGPHTYVDPKTGKFINSGKTHLDGKQDLMPLDAFGNKLADEASNKDLAKFLMSTGDFSRAKAEQLDNGRWHVDAQLTKEALEKVKKEQALNEAKKRTNKEIATEKLSASSKVLGDPGLNSTEAFYWGVVNGTVGK